MAKATTLRALKLLVIIMTAIMVTPLVLFVAFYAMVVFAGLFGVLMGTHHIEWHP